MSNKTNWLSSKRNDDKILINTIHGEESIVGHSLNTTTLNEFLVSCCMFKNNLIFFFVFFLFD